MPGSRHVQSLTSQSPTSHSSEGVIQSLSASDFPILNRLSIRRLSLQKGTFREPHWHANAHELGYCTQGSAIVTIALNHSFRESFRVDAGEMFFIPSGAMHYIQNLAQDASEFVLAFTHEQPEDFSITTAFACMSDAVLGNTFGLPATAFSSWDRQHSAPIGRLGVPATLDGSNLHVSSLKFAIESTPAQLSSSAGTAHLSDSNLWPALQDVAMYSLRITDQGMREPHWHPQTAEMGYVVSGEGRMTILDPDGSTDTYLIGPGDVYYVPAAYPHHIENIGSDVLHILVYFDQNDPGDVGFRSVVSDYSREVLAASFGLAEADLPELPFSEVDSLLVPRINPVDK